MISDWFQVEASKVWRRVDDDDDGETVAAVYHDGWIAYGPDEHVSGTETGAAGRLCADLALVDLGVLASLTVVVRVA